MFNRAWLAGGIPRTACVAAYEPICAVSLADSYINRANPGTYDAVVDSTAPAWGETKGWTFNGISDSLRVAIPVTDNYSAIVRYSDATNSASDKMIFGCYTSGANGARFGVAPSISNQIYYMHQNLQTASPGLLTGVLAVAGQSGYRNGVLGVEGILTDGAAYSANQGIGYWEFANGTNYGYWNGSIQALYYYDAILTPTQVRAVTDAMNMLPMRPRVPAFPSWMRGAALTQFRKLLGLRTGSRGVSE